MSLQPAGEGGSEVFSRHLIESLTGLAIYMLDPNGHVTSWNTGAREVQGYTEEEVIGQHFSVFFVNEEQKSNRPAMLLQSARTGGGITWDGWRVRKDGSRFWAAVISNPMRDKNGDLIGFATVTRDVSTQRQRAEQFRQMVEAAPTAMVMIDQSGQIALVNALAERMFGHDREAMLDQSVEMLVPQRLRDPRPDAIEAFLAVPRLRPMVLEQDLCGLRKDGTEFEAEIGLSTFEIDGMTMVVATVVDISDRKKAEDRKHALYKARANLINEMHHRVKNNLHVVYTLLDMQSARVRDNEALGVLRESQNRVRSMALIHQILYDSDDFMKVEFQTFLGNLVPMLMASYASDPELISLSINAADVRLPISQAMPCGLAVNELVSNALKHVFPSGRRGEIRIDLVRQPDDFVTLTVSDDGIGISDLPALRSGLTMGLQLLSVLAEQASAGLTIHASEPTSFELRFAVLNGET